MLRANFVRIMHLSTILLLLTASYASLVSAVPTVEPMSLVKRNKMPTAWNCGKDQGTSYKIQQLGIWYTFQEIWKPSAGPITLGPKKCKVAICSGYEFAVCNANSVSTLTEDLSVRNAAGMLSSSGTDCQLDFTSNGGIYYTWSPQGGKQLFTSFSSNRSCVSMN